MLSVPDVTIEEGAVVRDSIIMSDCTIGKGCVIDKSIIAENTKIGEGRDPWNWQ